MGRNRQEICSHVVIFFFDFRVYDFYDTVPKNTIYSPNFLTLEEFIMGDSDDEYTKKVRQFTIRYFQLSSATEQEPAHHKLPVDPPLERPERKTKHSENNNYLDLVEPLFPKKELLHRASTKNDQHLPQLINRIGITVENRPLSQENVATKPLLSPKNSSTTSPDFDTAPSLSPPIPPNRIPSRLSSSNNSISIHNDPPPSDIIPVTVRVVPVCQKQHRRQVKEHCFFLSRINRDKENREEYSGRLKTIDQNDGSDTTRVIALLRNAAPFIDQTTFIEESLQCPISLPNNKKQFDPDKTILEMNEGNMDATVADPSPSLYPYMFREFTRNLVQQEEIERIERERQRRVKSELGTNRRDQSHRESRVLRHSLSSQPELNHQRQRQKNSSQDHLQYPTSNYHGINRQFPIQNLNHQPLSTASQLPKAPVAASKPILPPLAKGKVSNSLAVRVPAPADQHIPNVSTQKPQIFIPIIKSSSECYNTDWTTQERYKTNRQAPISPSDKNGDDDEPDLCSLPLEILDKMPENELVNVVNSFYESNPRVKFKETYPFMAEGMIQRDCQTNMLKVFSQRVGQITIPDNRTPEKRNCDYVYFLVLSPGTYRGFYFDTHPKCLISAKFPSQNRIVLRGYAILAHPLGPREESQRENRWVCWNDSLGLMPIVTGAARTSIKKQPVWDKQLDIISIDANYENRRFIVTKVVALTSFHEKMSKFPYEAFMVTDAVYKYTGIEDSVFHSNTIKAKAFIKRTLLGDLDLTENSTFEMVIVPTFPDSKRFEFRGLLIISMPSTFWSRDKEWIRELLVRRADSYRCGSIYYH